MVNLIFVSKKFKAVSFEVLYQGLRPYIKKEGIKTRVSHLPCERYNSLKVILKNIAYVRKLKGDVFHITGNAHFFVLFLPGKKSVLTIHDLVMLEHYPKGIRHFLYKLFWVRLPAMHAAAVTCGSEKARDEILAVCPKLAGKLQVVQNSYAGFYKAAGYEFHAQCPSVLVVGTGWNKNLKRIILAVRDILCRLDIVGKLDSEMTALLEKYQIAYQNYTDISNQEMLQRYRECDLLCFPSEYEGFGVPIIEAQAVGRPVITSDLRPMRDVAGDAAILVNPKSTQEIRNAVLKIFQDGDLRTELIQKGRINAGKYAPEKTAKQYADIYKSLGG